jgi:truncated hemoglobin YjbI
MMPAAPLPHAFGAIRVQRFISNFYHRIQRDELLRHTFPDCSLASAKLPPALLAFWGNVLSGTSYTGRPSRHAQALPYSLRVFGGWQRRLSASIDAYFDHEEASEAKAAALNLSVMLQHIALAQQITLLPLPVLTETPPSLAA